MQTQKVTDHDQVMISVLAAMWFSFCIQYTTATQDLHVQAADSAKAIKIEVLKAGNKSLQEPLTNKLQYTATKPKRNSKSPRHESKPAC